jgi:hypothetical protein
MQYFTPAIALVRCPCQLLFVRTIEAPTLFILVAKDLLLFTNSLTFVVAKSP